MQIQTFKIFCDLAETESFSKAAALNGITQSAVSQQLRALEEKYRAMLIERGKKNFWLTPEGRVFLDASRAILDVHGKLGERIREMQDLVAGRLRIATVYSIGLHELPPYLKEFKRLYPDVEVLVEYRRSAQIYAEVHDVAADIGLVAFPIRKKGLSVDVFWRDKLVVICPPTHPLAKKRRVRLEALGGERFISFEPDLPTRKAVDRVLKGHHVKVQEVMEFDNIETVKRAVEIESGISIVPETTVSAEVRGGTLVALEIEGEDMWRPLGMLQKRNRRCSPAQRQFVSLLEKGPVPPPVAVPEPPPAAPSGGRRGRGAAAAE